MNQVRLCVVVSLLCGACTAGTLPDDFTIPTGAEEQDTPSGEQDGAMPMSPGASDDDEDTEMPGEGEPQVDPDGEDNPTDPEDAGTDDPEPEMDGGMDPEPTGDGGTDDPDPGDDDLCPDDPAKDAPGECGCGVPEGTCGPSCSGPSTLESGERLTPGEVVCSPNGRHAFGVSDSGEVTLSTDGVVVWNAGISGATRLTMQGDGNLVARDETDGAVWSSKSHGNDGAELEILDDGNVVIRLGDLTVWETDTSDVPPVSNGSISHVGTAEVWDADGQDLSVGVPAGTQNGDLMVLVLHRTDDVLPLHVDGWTRVAECYKRDNGYDCSTEDDCTSFANDDFCSLFGDEGQGGRDLAQSVFFRVAGSSEPTSYQFDLNIDSDGHPGWAILTTLRGAATTDPVRSWAHTGCDSDADSVFPSVLGEAGDYVLLSQSFDDAIEQSKFGAPSGTSLLGYVSDSDEAGFLFGGLLSSSGQTGAMETVGDGGPNCKDALVSLTVKPAG